MKSYLPETVSYNFKQLTARWGITEDDLEHYLLMGVIEKCTIEPLITSVTAKEKKRTLKLQTVLNSYAVDQIDEQLDNTEISKKERANLIDIRETDYVFKYWLQYKEWEIDKIIILIPHEEVERLDKIFNVSINIIPGLDSNHGNNIEISVGAVPPQTPEEYVKYLKSVGEPDAVIVVRLKNKYEKLNGYDCMKLVNPSKVESWTQSKGKQGRPRQWFYELRKKGLNILKDREIMTSSESQDSVS